MLKSLSARLLSRLFLSRRRRPAPAPRTVPWLETLETRIVPSVYQVQTSGDVTGGGVTTGHAGTTADAAANADGSTADTITFASGVSDITLTSGQQLELTGRPGMTTIDGGAAGVTIDGDNATRVFQVDQGATAALNGLTIQHGSSYGGGAIDNHGTLTVADSTFTANLAVGGDGSVNNGGAIWNERCAQLTVTASTFASNEADGGANSNNHGGAMLDEGTLTVTNSTFADNEVAGGDGSTNLGGALGSLADDKSVRKQCRRSAFPG